MSVEGRTEESGLIQITGILDFDYQIEDIAEKWDDRVKENQEKTLTLEKGKRQ